MPPPLLVPFKLSVFSSALFAASISFAAPVDLGTITNDDLAGDNKPTLVLDSPTVADSISINTKTTVAGSNFTLNIQNSLDVAGDTQVWINSDEVASGAWNGATHAFYVVGSHTKDTVEVRLNGNVDLRNTHANDIDSTYGANTLYAQQNTFISLGNPNSTTRIYSIASIPDAISAKYGSTIKFVSTHNQVLGTIDLSSTRVDQNYKASLVHGTFSGTDSFWYGDEASYLNTNADDRKVQPGELDLTFENGAQWSYLNIAPDKAIPKRISAITLRDGGIVNLFDEDIRNFLDSVGLLDQLADGNYIVDHDYVRIGDLRGSGGIFRLGLNGINKKASDMVFIEKSTQSGRHFFEPNDLLKLEPITPENTLIFALVGKEAKDSVSFSDKENLAGETLYDYELEIAHGPTTEDTLQREEFTQAREEFLNDESQQDIYIGGENWYIRRVTMKESTAAQAMTGTGYAAYDAAIEMERRDRRLAEAVRSHEGDNGLWVRVSHGRSGIEGQYRWDRTGVYVGFDREIVPGNTLGAWFSYTKGGTDYLDLNGEGTGDMTRYELALYDTVTFGTQYLDFVGRIGRVSAEFDVASSAYHTTGDFDQDYAAVSAEYGITLHHEPSGLFIEPQVQLQAAFLRSYDYDSERGMSVDADSETSLQGRAGFRAGRHFADDYTAGELYARADVYHQFTDGQSAVFSDNDGHKLRTEWGDRGTWTTLGLGGAVSWGGAYGLQLDVERAFGGDVDNTWLIIGRFNYSF